MEDPSPITVTPAEAPFADLPPDGWLHIDGDTLLAPISVRLVQTRGGGVGFGGLAMGAPRDGGVIDRRTLRAIRIPALLDGIWRALELSKGDAADALSRALHVRQIHDLIGEATGAEPASDKRRIPLGDLERFAQAYRRAASTKPSRAASIAAAEFGNISMATAHRWQLRCRALGLLPPKDQEATLLAAVSNIDRLDDKGRPLPLPEVDAARIARAWRDGIRRGNPAPSRRIAERWEVPVVTADRWLHELGKRGDLRPGHPAGSPNAVARRYMEELREQRRLPAPTDHPGTGEDADTSA